MRKNRSKLDVKKHIVLNTAGLQKIVGGTATDGGHNRVKTGTGGTHS